MAWVSALALVAAPADAQDRFFAPDKGLHFGVSFALSASGYGASALIFEDRRVALVAGPALGLGLGLAKEGYDEVAGSGWSWNDLAWDALGVGCGLAFAWLLDRLLFSDPGGEPRSARAAPGPSGAPPGWGALAGASTAGAGRSVTWPEHANPSRGTIDLLQPRLQVSPSDHGAEGVAGGLRLGLPWRLVGPPPRRLVAPRSR